MKSILESFGHFPVEMKSFSWYKGRCSYHDNCVEGLAPGPAVEERWGRKAVELVARERYGGLYRGTVSGI